MTERQALQAEGKHPAPCARHCEAKAFEIEIRSLKSALKQQADPVAWVFAPNNELLWPSEVEVTNPIEIDSYQPLYTSPPQRKPPTEIELDAEFNRGYKEGARDAYARAPQRKPLTDDMVHRAMIALNTASCGEFQPTFDEMRAALEAAHGIKETP